MRKKRPVKSLADRLDEIALHCARAPEYGSRSDDEIRGYNERGLFD